MTISHDQLIAGIESKNGFPLDPEQRRAILYGDGPLLIAAGPGTGKTEVLVSRCLKFICSDGVNPQSIMLTTFTDKAARSLEDRLTNTLVHLAGVYPKLASVDLSGLRVGTLHSLCIDILQEYRYTAYQNSRLLDEMENELLVYRSVVNKINHLKPVLRAHFGYMFGNKTKLANWDWALALVKMLNRTIEDRIDLNALQQADGSAWQALYEVNRIYEDALSNGYSCGYSHLLKHFLAFLDSGQGDGFLQGDSSMRPPLTHVLIDEYQDTNPIQESIYFRLSDVAPHNITIVGDDDQALYRFRGGTVECMVGFSSSCQARWGVTPQMVHLSNNYRSDSDIVQWCNTYITSFPEMGKPDVRIKLKPPLKSPRNRTGSHPAVGLIHERKVADCPPMMARLLKDLKERSIIQDYSQCVLLLPSTQNSSRRAGPYQDALEKQGIPVYNPRSKDFLDNPEVAQCLGAFIRIIDPNLAHANNVWSANVQNLVQGWVDDYDSIALVNGNLADYVNKSATEISNSIVGSTLTPRMLTILYRVLAHEPFVHYQKNPEKDLRLSKLTRIFDSFCSQYGHELKTDSVRPGELSGWWYNHFYSGLCGYLARKGLDDDEEEDVTCPAGYFPIMTIHQAKGLEFDFVFAGNLGRVIRKDDGTHRLEEDLRQFRVNQPNVIHSIPELRRHDDVRRHYVAYSRARHALVLIAADDHLKKTASQTSSFGGEGGVWVRRNIRKL